MKFKKLIFGLAAFPLLLTSCNRTMSYKAAFDWVSKHYKLTDGDIAYAVATVSWDYHGTSGETAKGYVFEIFEGLSTLAGIEHLNEGTIPLTDIKANNIGHKIMVNIGNPKQEMIPLNAGNFESTFTAEDGSIIDKDNVYKVSDGCFSGLYTHKTYEYYHDDDDPEKCKWINTTRIRVFNEKGYCTDFGCKVNGKWIDKDNTVKCKLLIHFTYADDPID